LVRAMLAEKSKRKRLGEQESKRIENEIHNLEIKIQNKNRENDFLSGKISSKPKELSKHVRSLRFSRRSQIIPIFRLIPS
jgi:hypothetical protein